MAATPGALARWRGRFPFLLGAAIFAVAAFVLHRELRDVHYRDVAGALEALPATAILAAVALTAVNYLVLTGYDQMAFTYIRKPIARGRIALASFVGFAISMNVGFALLSGTSARYRFYSRWGLTPADLSRVVLFYSVTIWLGLFLVGGSVLAFAPLGQEVAPRGWLRLAGFALLGVAAAYGLLAVFRRRPMRAFAFEIPPPPLRLVPLQFVLGAADWLLSSAVLYALLPAGAATYPQVVGALVLAQVAGVLSHVPGGLGVFESVILLQLGGQVPTDALLGSLVLFRLVFFVLPLAAALMLLLVDEFRQRRHVVRQWGSAFGSMTAEVAPKVLSLFLFAAGAFLLFSGATPTDPARLKVLPLSVVEASHFVASVVGVALLLVSHGVARRLQSAYATGVGLLVVAVAASLLKGGDWREALLLCGMLAVVGAARSEFDRGESYWATRFSPGWLVAVLAVVAGSVWLGTFAYRHVEFSEALWWRFELRHDAARFLRASTGAALALLAFAAFRARNPRPRVGVPATGAELEEAASVVAAQPWTLANLALLGDKALLWNAARHGFVAYAVRGRTWVALGDPVSTDPEAAAPLIRAFVEKADDFDALPVFYQTRSDHLDTYADYGLLHARMGETARVPLDAAAPDEDEGFRRTLEALDAAGATVRVVPAAEAARRLPEMAAVSEAWLRRKRATERGFSLGRFDPAYVGRFPAVLLERGGRLEAFATVWTGGGRAEVAVDLARTGPEAPSGAAEGMFLHLMRWAREEGYRWFDLGLAPPREVDVPLARLWARMGRTIHLHGGGVYDFEALRAFRDRFNPVWEPRYLVYPGGLPLRRVVADLSALLTGETPRRTRR